MEEKKDTTHFQQSPNKGLTEEQKKQMEIAEQKLEEQQKMQKIFWQEAERLQNPGVFRVDLLNTIQQNANTSNEIVKELGSILIEKLEAVNGKLDKLLDLKPPKPLKK